MFQKHRPRLVDTARLGGPADAGLVGGVGAFGSVAEVRRGRPAVTLAATLAGRTGYADNFLGDFLVPLPSPGGSASRDVLPVGSDATGRLDYMHFSVVMSRSRRLAMFVAVNIDGSRSVRIERSNDRWLYDGRIPVEYQIGDELYADNELDRGHLVRREDPNWGDAEDAETANADTFHFTNCTPQMAAFNQHVWLGLENYILQNTRRWAERVSVFSGPVFGTSDPEYRGVRIPAAYWKIVAFLRDDGKPSASGYTIDQGRQLNGLEAAFGRYKTFQRSVREIERISGLDFGELAYFDAFSNEEAATGTRIEAVLRSLGDIRL